MSEAYSSISGSANVRSPDGIEHPVSIGHRAEIHQDVTLGAFTFINTDTIIYRNSVLGRYCSLARGCEIGAANHPTDMISSHSFQYSDSMFPHMDEYKFPRPENHLQHPNTTIGSDVWIGAQCILRAGVSVGHGAIIGANSVVTDDVAPYAIVGGSTARIIRYRFSDSIIERLLKVAWWNLSFSQIKGLPFGDVERCLEFLEAKAV